MAAHPDLKESEAKQIVAWIQTLASTTEIKKSLPVNGSIKDVTLGKPVKQNGVLVLSATYIDKAAPGLKSQSALGSVALRNPLLNFNRANNLSKYTASTTDENFLLVVPKTTGSLSLDNIDLTGITAAELSFVWEKAPTSNYHFEIRLDSPNGTKIGEANLEAGKNNGVKLPESKTATASLLLNLQATAGNLHNIYIVSKADNSAEPNTLKLSTILFSSK